MPRKAKWRAIKRHRSYTVDEAARALFVTKATIRNWIKDGLPVLNDQRPLLILGHFLINYLKDRAPKKQTCALDECFCLACRMPQKAAFRTFECKPLNASTSNLRALCSRCSTVMHKRVSTSNLERLKAISDVTVEQG